MSKNSNKPALTQTPSTFPRPASAEVIENLQMISEVFEQIEKETAEIAEEIFDYLIDVSDWQIATGTIPPHKNKKINGYIKILNRLFLLSKKYSKESGFRILNRAVVQKLDNKTFTICMCFDGGVSLDILCHIANMENQARTPTISPVKITVKHAFAQNKDLQNSL